MTLNNGVEMPVLGFGVFQIPPEETEQAVATALEVVASSLYGSRLASRQEPGRMHSSRLTSYPPPRTGAGRSST